MRTFILGAAAAALIAAAPAAANKPPTRTTTTPTATTPTQTTTKSASAACKAERTALGATAFAAKYGKTQKRGKKKQGKAAFGKCVSTLSKQSPTVVQQQTQETVKAAKTCRTERESMGEDAFAQKYGTNANKRNAFGKCVSTAAKAAEQS